ncbi:hypothetical protein L7F22_025535 [Adiantum nelumboides]|nr:hypothetical protein [Adiantum nelumboides]
MSLHKGTSANEQEKFSSDQYAVDDSLPFISNILMASFFSLLGIIIVLCWVQWTFLVILVPLGYIYIGLQKYYRCTSRELRRLDSTSRSPIYSSFNEALDGSVTIRAFRAQDIFCSKNESFVALNQRTSFSEVAASLWLSIRLQMLASFIIFFISIMTPLGHQVRYSMNPSTAEQRPFLQISALCNMGSKAWAADLAKMEDKLTGTSRRIRR